MNLLAKNEKQSMEMRRSRVVELYLKGWRTAEMAAELGASVAVIRRDVARIREEWKGARIRDFEAVREMEIKKLEAVEREAWLAWQLSKEDEVIEKAVRQKKAGGEDSAERVERTIRRRHGDPRLLTAIKSCIERRCELLGLGSPPPPNEFAEGEFTVQAVMDELSRDDDYLEFCRHRAMKAIAGKPAPR